MKKKRLTREEKEKIIKTVEETRKRSQWRKGEILRALSLSRSRYYHWQHRQEEGWDGSDGKPSGRTVDRVLPEEVRAVCSYAVQHPELGYRPLTYQMIDEETAYLSCSSVYRILDQHNLLARWKRREGKEEGRLWEVSAPDEQWHTDILYLWVRGRWYFFVGILDNYSRYIVHWDLLLTMQAQDVTLVIQEALEKVEGAEPRIVTDHGSQFTGKDFRTLIRAHELEHIKTAVAHPESNGRMERFHRSLRQEGLREQPLEDYYQARKVIEAYVEEYNHKRLHSSLHYLRPVDYYRGDPEKLLAVRREKLKRARERRKKQNQKLEREAA